MNDYNNYNNSPYDNSQYGYGNGGQQPYGQQGYGGQYTGMDQYRMGQQGRSYALEEATMKAYMTRVMSRVYLKMFIGLVVTALSAGFLLSNESILLTIFNNQILFWGLMIGELAIVFVVSGMINKLSNTAASALFYVYSALNGITFAAVCLAFTGESIMLTFFVTAGVFLAMCIYGYTTKSDLSSLGTYLFMALIGVIIASIANFFFQSSTVEWIISFVGVGIFVGLTAWDTQKIKQMMMETSEENVGKVSTLGALSLYLDFVNLFLYLLRFLGRRN